jgi:hypothetical protein
MRRLAAAALLLIGASSAALAQSAAPAEPPLGVHLGVATCSGSNCHGSTKPVRGSSVLNNEYLTWSRRDLHAKAYVMLLGEPAKKMAAALNLGDPTKAERCLNCHADTTKDTPGPLFHIEDGVGCEACHGGASRWLGSHISNATHQQNLERGLFPTENPIKRAELCLNCHFGDSKRYYLNHELYGAGHPRLAFELDTYTAIQPAHFAVSENYTTRKGRITDMQVWTAGQVIALVRRMDAVIDQRSHSGLWPDFATFDCQSCHHEFVPNMGPRLSSITGLDPGSVKFNDANAVMLRVAATRVAPGLAKSLDDHMLALDRATQSDWGTVQSEARTVRDIALSLETALAQHEYSPADMRALADALIALGTTDQAFSHDEQICMALQSIVAGLKSYPDLPHLQAITAAMEAVTDTFPKPEVIAPKDGMAPRDAGVFHYDAFVKALKNLQRTMR